MVVEEPYEFLSSVCREGSCKEWMQSPPLGSTVLEAVHFDGGLRDLCLYEERKYLLSLITLKLDDLTGFHVVDDSAVAGEFLLESLQDLLGIILLGQSLQSGQGLPTVALLDTDVDIVVLRADVVGVTERITFGKRVNGVEVLHAHAMGRS